MQPDFAQLADDVIPISRLQRFATLLGLLLLFGGFAVLFLAPNHSDASANLLLPAVISTIAGAGVTAFCYIYNAARRW